MLQPCRIYACATGTLGLNLSRAPWDPYPWVSGVQQDCSAQRAGIRTGDTVLELNGCDVLGLKISELAARLREHWQSGAEYVSMVVWRNRAEEALPGADAADAYDAEHGINQQSLQKFATCLQHVAQLLECPVCLEVIKPPGWQCCNGHVLCNTCRVRSEKCPVCRVPLGPRGRCLLSDKLFTLLAESFPCDGVKTNVHYIDAGNNSNSNSHSHNNNNNNHKRNAIGERSKCSIEYHNHPKMAFVTTKQLAAKETPKKTKYARQQQQQQQMEQQDEQQERQHEQLQRPLEAKRDEAALTAAAEATATATATTIEVVKINSDKVQISKGNGRTQAQVSSNNNNNNNNDDNNNNSNSIMGCKQSTKPDNVLQSKMEKLPGAQRTLAVGQAATVQQGGQRGVQFLNCLQFSDYNNNSSRNNKKQKEEKNSVAGNDGNDGNDAVEDDGDNDGIEDDDNLLVKPKLKSSKKSSQITGQDQDELLDDEVANINNGMPTNGAAAIAEAANGTVYVQLRQQQQQQQQLRRRQQQQEQQQYENYHCPTGKSCCSYVPTSIACASGCAAALPTNKLSTASKEYVENFAGRCYDDNTAEQVVGVAKSWAATATATSATSATAATAESTNDISLSCVARNWQTGLVCQGRQLGTTRRSTTKAAAQSSRMTVTTPAENLHQQGVAGEEAVEGADEREQQPTQSIKPSESQLGFHDEWQLLQHLSNVHRLAVLHFYGTFGERLHVPCTLPTQQQRQQHTDQSPQRRHQHQELEQQQTIACLNLRPATATATGAGSGVNVQRAEWQRFFLAVIALGSCGGSSNTTAAARYAIFLWHIGHAGGSSEFETIIESHRSQVKWFGRAQPLTSSWQQLAGAGQYLVHELPAELRHEAFDVVVKIK